MKDFRFYLEYDSPAAKRKGTVKNPGPHNGTVIAVMPENRWHGSKDVMFEAIGSVQNIPDGGVCGTSASRAYLSENCRRIPESLARQIHPTLFQALARMES